MWQSWSQGRLNIFLVVVVVIYNIITVVQTRKVAFLMAGIMVLLIKKLHFFVSLLCEIDLFCMLKSQKIIPGIKVGR